VSDRGDDSPDYEAWPLERLFAGRTLLEADLRSGRPPISEHRGLWLRRVRAELARVNAAIVRRRAQV
jgi:hypothetical protein